MWFLYFYIASVVLCYLIIVIFSKSISNELSKYGEIEKERRKDKAGLIMAGLPYLIPFVNIILLLVLIFAQKEIKERVIKEKLKERENKND